MASNIETRLRSPAGYDLAAEALARMRRANVWPTPLNFELWLCATIEPKGDVAQALSQIAARGEVVTEAQSEALAAKFLARERRAAQIVDVGQNLGAQLTRVSEALSSAQKTSADYGRTLAGASQKLSPSAFEADAPRVIADLAAATQTVYGENAVLERRLNDANSEVQRLRRNLEVAERDAATDALTGLANRKIFDETIARSVGAASGRHPFGLALLDIDHFKQFNDRWGHQTGDQIIRFVASVIGRHGEEPRLAARYGGEEFALLLPNTTEADALGVLEAIRTEISSRALKRRSTDEDLGAVTISAGFSICSPGEACGDLVARVDGALYASKDAGRNRVTCAPHAAPAGAV